MRDRMRDKMIKASALLFYSLILNFGLLGSIFAGLQVPPGSHAPNQEEQIGQIAARLQLRAESGLREKNVNLSPNVRQELFKHIEFAARRIVQDGATPEQITRAEENLDTILSIIPPSETGGEIQLDRHGVHALFTRLCPIFPFC
jgi:hypothetical protein